MKVTVSQTNAVKIIHLKSENNVYFITKLTQVSEFRSAFADASFSDSHLSKELLQFFMKRYSRKQGKYM